MSVTPPRVTNPFTNFFHELISAAVNGGELAIEAALVANFPFLANPACKLMLDEMVQYIGGFATEELSDLVSKIVIDVQTNGEKSAVVKAASKLQAAKKAGDPNGKESAKQELVNAWGNIIHSDGLRSP